MSLEVIIIIGVIIIGVIVIYALINQKITQLEKTQTDDRSVLLLQEQLNHLSQTLEYKLSENSKILDSKLSETNKITQGQFQESNRFMSDVSKESRVLLDNVTKQFNEMSQYSQVSIKEVTEKITRLEETNRQVVGFSEQLKSLQDILKNPKQRGVLGEYYLEESLKNVLPPNSYQMQYRFKNGEAVDAVVFVDKKIIPIDSKFSLETYEKILNCNDGDLRKELQKKLKLDLKNRIDETAKYVRPKENTVDFAFMFIPSESLYYDLLSSTVSSGVSSRDLIEYAFRDKHVIIVSPTSFLAYLQTVLQGLRALKIEESAKEIQKRVEQLGVHLKKYEDYHSRLGKSLSTVVGHYNNSHKELGKVDKDVIKITGSEKGLELETEELKRPALEI
ncbi:MAG TPA: DNA recombination protein RmuC [Candidatus Moranbacteria bacterium]|nr:DNA recombination protein RmuC [Candidatus Moranbacteria bacterium]